jgi:high affinity Mn2+ porin
MGKKTFKGIVVYFILILSSVRINGQPADSIREEKFSIHVQTTVIDQYKPAFKADYSGKNSLVPGEENKLSVTSTLFLGVRVWHGASFYINPEIGGGSGLSGAMGVAASTNGETYKIGNPAPQFELARIFIRQIFALGKETEHQEGDYNQLEGSIPARYLSVVIGKICVTDYFDKNTYNHDPRTQFMSWGLMNNGAWDFPANTKGYTPSAVLEFVTPLQELRYGFSLVPAEANGMTMNWKINKAGSHSLEYSQHYSFAGKSGTLRLFSFFTTANMGNYYQSIALNPTSPDISASRKYGHTKYGFGVNLEQSVNNDMGLFIRASWNDGNNETWAFTEIDRSVSFGFSSNGSRWERQNDILGLAYVISGISKPHRDYLMAGGYGFILGDGKLNYSPEHLAELYYSVELTKNIYLSGAYQFILNPGYNKDRGPVNVFSIRVHTFI